MYLPATWQFLPLQFPGGGGAYGFSYSRGVTQMGDKVQRGGGSNVWGHHALEYCSPF